MAVPDAGLVGDQSEVPVSPPDDATDGLLAEASVPTGRGPPSALTDQHQGLNERQPHPQMSTVLLSLCLVDH
jgi:hypothetical protein